MSEAAVQGQAPGDGLPGDSGSEGRPETRTDGRGRGDTRARIQQVAVELFTEHGYEKTSLREIAERLDVTKAALYYHFKSKEDIVASLVEDYYGQMDALVTWAQEQPGTAATRAEILRRYVSLIAGGDAVFRMLHQNQAAVHGLASSKKRSVLFRERLGVLVGILIGPDAGTPERVRAAMALGGVSVSWMFFADEVTDKQELSRLVLAAASELIGTGG